MFSASAWPVGRRATIQRCSCATHHAAIRSTAREGPGSRLCATRYGFSSAVRAARWRAPPVSVAEFSPAAGDLLPVPHAAVNRSSYQTVREGIG